MRQSVLVAALAAAVAMAVPMSVRADATNGAALAQRWCAACHVVARDQRQASADVPPFHEIAARPGFDQARLAVFLLDPHPKMPSMNLSRAEAADLAAYIATQK
jgi:mono/diheme cytochrome c family protein